VICPSASVWPSPLPFAASLLVTDAIRVMGLGSTASVTAAVTVTGTILWFGGQRTAGDALALSKTGGTASM
jgi:hypothetical protein